MLVTRYLKKSEKKKAYFQHRLSKEFRIRTFKAWLLFSEHVERNESDENDIILTNLGKIYLFL